MTNAEYLAKIAAIEQQTKQNQRGALILCLLGLALSITAIIL